MSKYEDYTKWTEDTYDCGSLSEWVEYKPDQLYKMFTLMIKKAEDSGLEGCYIQFRSCREPYEDWLGYPEAYVVGYRPLNQYEKDNLAFEERVQKFADDRGIPIYQAREAVKLIESGVF